MKREVLQYPDPRLRKKAVPVMDITDDIRALAEDMVETMYADDGIGLAAPQVGEGIRMVVIDLSGPNRREGATVYINPELEALDEEVVESEEGCLSVPELRSNVKRRAKVRVHALDLEGKEFTEEAEDVASICLQHECDHLDGVLFIDHLSRLKRNIYDTKVKKKLKAGS